MLRIYQGHNLDVLRRIVDDMRQLTVWLLLFMHLIRSGAVGGVENLMQKFGGNPVELIRRVGLSPAQFHNPNTFVSLSKMAELLELCAAAVERPLFGLSLARRQNPGVLGDLLAAVSQEASLATALDSMERNLYLHATGVHVKPVTQGRKIRLELSFDISTPLGVEQLLQLGTGHLLNLIAAMLNVAPDKLMLCLRQTQPVRFSQENNFYDIRFRSDFDGLILHDEWLYQKPNLSERILREHFRDYLSHLRERYPNNLKDQVCDIIGRLLPTGECSVERVAASLGLRHRALQRRLTKEGSSYVELLRATRQSIAEQHLRHGFISITDLALNLGYADVAVFSRYFKSWTGCSPREWRKQEISSQQ